MTWTPIRVGAAETAPDGARIWPLSDQPPKEWQSTFDNGVGTEVTGPVGGPGPRLSPEGVVWAVPPADSEAETWVDASNRAYEEVMVERSDWQGTVRAGGI